MTVLIITHSNDHAGTAKVQEAIEARGVRCFRFNTDTYPGHARMSLGFGAGVPRRRLITPQGTLDLDQVSAIWYRRLRVGQQLDDQMDPQLRHTAVEEARRTFRGMMTGGAPFVMDPLQNIRAAENKEFHGRVARSVGLETPDSLFSNHPEAVRAFFKAHPEGVVTKMQATFAVIEDGDEQVIFTNRLTEADLDDLDGLSLCPMIFQAMVPKKLELRVTVVGRTLFCAAVDSGTKARADVDWRREGDAFADQWQPHTLPQAVADKVLALMDRLGLNYGAMDIILTPDNRYVFLEVNPCGEFFWLERNTGLPITDAIAAVLVDEDMRRPNNRRAMAMRA